MQNNNDKYQSTHVDNKDTPVVVNVQQGGFDEAQRDSHQADGIFALIV